MREGSPRSLSLNNNLKGINLKETKMESRAELRGTGSSKWLELFVVVIVTLALGLIALYVAKNVSAPASVTTSTQAAPTPAASSPLFDTFDGCAQDFTPC
jgi:hypothetical protein